MGNVWHLNTHKRLDHLAEDRDVLSTVLVGEGTHKSVAEAALADPRLPLVFLRPGKPNHRHVDGPDRLSLPSHAAFELKQTKKSLEPKQLTATTSMANKHC